MLNRRQNKAKLYFVLLRKTLNFFEYTRETISIMVFWQSHSFLILLLAFSGLNLIKSDCGADVDRLSGGFCENRDLRRFDKTDYNKDLSQRFRNLERNGL